MKVRDPRLGFSLVEVAIALGLAALCLLPVMALLPVSVKTNQAAIQQTTANSLISGIAADLNAAARLPNGLRSKQFDLPSRWEDAYAPTVLYFENDGSPINTSNITGVPTNAVFRATVTYRQPPTITTSVASIEISWPAAQEDPTKVTGSSAMFVAINR